MPGMPVQPPTMARSEASGAPFAVGPGALRMPWSAKCRVCRSRRRPRHVPKPQEPGSRSAPAPSACPSQRNARYVGPAADQGTAEASGAWFGVGPGALRMPWSAKCRVCRPGRRPRHVRSLRSPVRGRPPAPSACLGQRNARYVGPAADQGTSETSGAPFAVGPRRPPHALVSEMPGMSVQPPPKARSEAKHPDAQDLGRLHGEEPPPRHQGLTQRPVPVDESPAGRGRQVGAGQGLC